MNTPTFFNTPSNTSGKLRVSEVATMIGDSAFERITQHGASALSMAELLTLAIGGEDATGIANNLMTFYPTLRELNAAGVIDLGRAVYGVGPQVAARIKALMELGRRSVATVNYNQVIKTPAEIAEVMIPLMGALEQEEVWTVNLDARNRIISTGMIYRGSINSANMRTAEIFKVAIRVNAKSIAILHNHPSGDPTPSQEDIFVTKEIVKAGKTLDIELVDHIVIGQGRHVSLKERGLGF